MSFKVKNTAARLWLSASAVIFILVLLFSACRKTAEPIVRANYDIQNLTPLELRVEALQGTAAVPLLKDTVEPNKLEKIYEAVEGTGGHPYPSNFFTEFKVFAITATGDSLVYQGVKNSDWKQENNDNDVIDLVLKIEF